MTDSMLCLKSILAHQICDEINCTDCKELFGSETCPSDVYDYEEKVGFSKQLAEKLKCGKCDLGDIDDLNVDDLMDLVNEITHIERIGDPIEHEEEIMPF